MSKSHHKEKQIKKITAGKVLSWIVGVYFILNGIMVALGGKFITGILQFVAAVLIVPPTNNFLRKKYDFEISGGLKVLIFFVFILIIPLISSWYSISDYSYPSSGGLPDDYSDINTNKPSFEILNKKGYVDSYGYSHVVGEVQNTGTKDATYVKVYVTYKDANKEAVSTDFAYVQGTDIPAGQTRSFEIQGKEPEWKYFSVYVKSN